MSSKTPIEDKKYILQRITNVVDGLELKKKLVVLSYYHLHKALNLDETWTQSRLRRVVSSLHYSGGYVGIVRLGDPTHGNYAPRGYMFSIVKTFEN